MSPPFVEHPEELLPWYVNGTLEGEELRRLEKHLASCLVCRRELEALRGLRHGVREAAQISDEDRPGAAGLDRLLDALDGEHRPAVPVSERRGRYVWPLAAAVVAAFGMATLLDWPWHSQPPVVERAAGNEESLRSSLAAGEILSRDAFLLRWETSEVWEEAHFSLRLTTLDLEILHEVRDLATTHYQVPAEVFTGLSASTRLLWQVEAVRFDGETARSATLTITLE